MVILHRLMDNIFENAWRRPIGAGPLRSPTGVAVRWLWVGLQCLLFISVLGCHGGGGSGTTAPPPPSFTLALSPPNLSIPAGGGGYATVTVTRISGFAEAITLSLDGAPTGVVGKGTVAGSARTGQLALLVAPDVAPQSLDTLRVKGTSASLTQTAPFRLVVAPRLPVGQIPVDLVQASGGQQRLGGMENTVVALEPVVAKTSKDALGNTDLRHGFRPSGSHN